MRRLFAALALALLAAGSARAQAPRLFPFRAAHYDVQVVLNPDNQSLTALAKVDFVATEVSRTVLVELHPDLIISSVKTSMGQSLTFERDETFPLLLNVALPGMAAPGKQVTLYFEYGGSVTSEDDSPTRGVRFATMDKTSASLLLPARWFPLTNYPSNRYTGTFKIVVPDTMAVAGTGKPDPPVMMPALGKDLPGQASYTFHCDHPSPAGSFVAGNLQLSPVQTEGYRISVFTPPAQAQTATAYANSLAHIMSFFSDAFGTFDSPPDLTIAQMPDGGVAGFSAPGLLLISARQWTTQTNNRLLSRLAAGQWWGVDVLPASASDAWISDGLSRYAEAMYAEQADGVAGLHKALQDFSIGALMYEGAAPIAQAQNLGLDSDQYQSIVDDKGAMVFHMLRSELGDDAFTALLRAFYKEYKGRVANLEGFEAMAAAMAPPPKDDEPPINLVSFFSQWLDSTGIPEFTLNYVVYRTPQGFKVVGKIHQDLETFQMPVEIRVDTEGNPESKKILVSGTSTDFQIDTFGRPKPNGVLIDPNNNLLQSNPGLRVRAMIARGESQASVGKYFEAIQQYQAALDVQPTDSLAHFRMGEAMFYQKNYQAAANSFRSAIGGDLDPKWVEVWSHIYIGMIYDLLGERARAVNEYSLAQHTHDDTAGAQEAAARYLQTAYTGQNAATATAQQTPAQQTAAPPASPAPTGDTGSDKPVLKRRTDD